MLLCVSNAIAADAPADAAATRQIASIVDPIVEKEIAAGVPGAAFVFVRNGAVVYERGYGVADIATKTKVDPERTVWPIASITKTVTALGALQLVADGRVKLDGDLNRYLKRVQVPAQGYAPLTLRHILSHTGALDEIPGRRYDGRQPPDMAAFLKDKLVRYREPGKLTAYSTYGIALAGVLIEDVSGESYADYLKQHIFAPAGMGSARVMLRQGDEKGVATPYEIDDGRATAIQYEWYQTPATSSMVATAADMGRLLLVHLADSNRLLSPALMRAMHEQQATLKQTGFDGYLTMEIGFNRRDVDPDDFARRAYNYVKNLV